MKLIDFSKDKKMKDLLKKMGAKPNKNYKKDNKNEPSEV